MPTRFHLLVDGQPLEAEPDGPDLHRFRLALPAAEVRLVSPAGRPAAQGGSRDDRLLGVQVFGLCWCQGTARLEVPLTSPDFAEGFHDLEEAAFRWTNGNALLAGELLPPWQGEVTLELRAAPLPPGPGRARPRHPDAVLLGRFESLGDDCELGFAQRHFDATPPLGLFRWSGTDLARLMAGLEDGFASLGDPETTAIFLSKGEYRLDTSYVTLHTRQVQVADTLAEREAVLLRGCSLLRLLRRKLLAEIAEARRFFVFKTADPAFDRAAMLLLHATFRRHGPAPLLCVTLGPPGAPTGRVERVAPGLYAASMDRFVLAEGPYDQWREICSRAWMLHEAGPR